MKFILLGIILVCSQFSWAQSANAAFVVKEKDLIPEGITYDPAENVFYLSSIHKRKVIKISSEGKVSDFVSSGQDGIQQVLGMSVRNGKLWLCNNTPDYDSLFREANVHVYDVKSKKLVTRYKLSDGKKHLFNDLYVVKSGDAYITDSDAGAIYQIRNGSTVLEELLPPGSLVYPNGITASEDEKKLFVSTGSLRGIVSIDLETKQVRDLLSNHYIVFGYDGLYRYKNSLIGIQNTLFPEAVHQIMLTNDGTRITALKFLSGNDSRFDIPTTGVIAQDSFYFIANSQLWQIIGTQGKIRDPETLTEPLILKMELK